MAMTLPGHSAPAVGFEVPLEMLAACHGRVQHQCETLARLAAHLHSHDADRPAQEAASAVRRYFDTAAQHHHGDEEQDLFPALIEVVAGADPARLRELTSSVCGDHRLLDQRWAVLRQDLASIARGSAAPLDEADLAGYIQLYERHIAREEAELLPMAARMLGDIELDRIGLSMRRRRGTAATA
jgi:hemerythrin-like domain-containing protein